VAAHIKIDEKIVSSNSTTARSTINRLIKNPKSRNGR